MLSNDYHKLLDRLYEQLYLLFFNNCTEESFIVYESNVNNFLFTLDYHMKNPYNIHFQQQVEHLLKQFMQFIVYSRNIYWGMGRKLTTYLLLYKLYEFYPHHAKKTLDIICDHHHSSWCDLKYFCKFVDQYYHNRNHPLVLYFIDKMNHALQQHTQHSNQQSIHNPNLEFIQLQKWVPRESGACAWIFHKLWKRHGNITSKMYRKQYVQSSGNPINNDFLHPCMKQPGKLLKSMMQIIRHSTIFTGDIQDKINDLNQQWNIVECQLDHIKIISQGVSKFIIPILDLSDFSDIEAFDMMAWSYLLSCRSQTQKRIFVSTSISNWFNFDHCISLYDICCQFSKIWKQYGKLACNPLVSVLLLQQALLDTQSFHNMDDFTLVFLYANNNYSVTKIQELYDSWTYGNCKPKFAFWNFNGSGYYDNIYDVFSETIGLFSGNYKSTFSDLLWWQYCRESNIKRLLNHLNGITVL